MQLGPGHLAVLDALLPGGEGVEGALVDHDVEGPLAKKLVGALRKPTSFM